MNEIENICKSAALLARAEERCWLGTIVRVRGSAYRRPGARILFTREQACAGCISAGCVEAELVRSGSFHANTDACICTYEASRPDDEEPDAIGSGCGGNMDVLVEPVTGGCHEALTFIEAALSQQQRLALVTVIHSDSPTCKLGARVARAGNRSFSTGCTLELESELELMAKEALEAPSTRTRYVRRGAVELLLEVLQPSPRLFVFGAGTDVLPLVTYAAGLGWDITVVSGHDRPSERARFALVCRYVVCSAEAAVRSLNRSVRGLAVVMAHDYNADQRALAALLDSRARYIGVLGPLARTQRMLIDIEKAGGSTLGALARIHAPVGLNIGAETPAEIALAIVAEAQAALRRADAHALRDKPAIHDTLLPDHRGTAPEAAE
ncbi:MAG: XdhC family protein [Myxococcota bacterium]